MFNFLRIDGKFYKIMSQFVDIVLINILFIITSLPLITVGAGISAVSTVYINYDVGKTNQIIPKYFKAFKKNIRQSTFVHLILSLLSILLILNWVLFPAYQGSLKWLVLITLFIFTFIIYFYSIIIYPYIAKFHDTLVQASNNIMKIFFDNILWMLIMGLMTGMPMFILVLYPWTLPIFLYYFIFVGFSLLFYVNTLILNKIFEKYIIE